MVLQQKETCRMIGLRVQIEQNEPVLEKATPFPPDGATLFAE